MSKLKRKAASAASRKQAIAAVSGIKREKPKLPEPLPGKGRRGRRGVVVYLHPLAKDVLQRIAHEHRKTIQELGVEAFNRLFLEYGEKPIG
jgi:hypothetical protein